MTKTNSLQQAHCMAMEKETNVMSWSTMPVQDKLHVTESGKGVQVRADQPHLVSLGGGRLSTAVTLLPLQEGATTLGSGDDQDIVVRGTGVRAAHCCIHSDDGIIILTPTSAACLVTVDGSKVDGPTILSQGCMICIGRSNYFRFNHPEQAAQLKTILPANTRVSVVPLQFTSSYFKGRPSQAKGHLVAGDQQHLLLESQEEEAACSGATGGQEDDDCSRAAAVHRDRLEEESFSSKLKRFERLSASLPAGPDIGASSMGPPSGGAKTVAAATKAPAVGYWGHVGEKLFTKQTATTSMPMSEVSSAPGESSSPGRRRSSSGSSCSRPPLPAKSPLSSSDDGPPLVTARRRPSDPGLRQAEARSADNSDDVFVSEPLCPEECGTKGSEADAAAGADGLTLKHRRMVEERKLAEEADEQEQRRLEEILQLCAEYERQAESDLLATASASIIPSEFVLRCPVDSVDASGADPNGSSQGSSEQPKMKVNGSFTTPQHAAIAASFASKNGLDLIAPDNMLLHDSDSGVGSSASLAGRDGHSSGGGCDLRHQVAAAADDTVTAGDARSARTDAECDLKDDLQGNEGGKDESENKEDERIYDDPAVLILPPPLPPRNHRLHCLDAGSIGAGSACSSLQRTRPQATPTAANIFQRPGLLNSADTAVYGNGFEGRCGETAWPGEGPAGNARAGEGSYFVESHAASGGSTFRVAASVEGSPLRRLALATAAAAGHSEAVEAKAHLKKLRKCQSEAMHTLSSLKRHIFEMERQQADAVNELDIEWSVLESEQKYELDQLNMQLQTNAHLKAKRLASLDRIAKLHEEEIAKIEAARRRLRELESRRAYIDKDLRSMAEGQKGQNLLSLYAGELEAIDNQRKFLEDLELQQLEVEARYQDEKSSVQRELTRQQADLQHKISSAEERLDGVAWRQRELLRRAKDEVEDIERLRKGLVADFRKEKERLLDLDERAAELERLIASGSSPARQQTAADSSGASLASLVTNDSLLSQMWSSPSNTMDRSVLAKLKAADTLVKEEQRRLSELKASGLVSAESSFLSADVQKLAMAAAHGGSSGLVLRLDSEALTLQCGEAISDCDKASSSSNDDMDRYLELQKLLAQARAHVQNVGDSDGGLCAERRLRKDLERQLADEKEKRQQIVEEEVRVRERRRAAATMAQERPLTRFLPVRVKEFDLRQHVELAGHNVDACPFVELDSKVCRGFLLKMGSKTRSWNKRWFIFDREKKALLYFIDKDEAKPRGTIYFQSIEDVFVDHMRTVKSPHHKMTFCVKTYDRPYYLIAKTPETMSIWIDVIFSGAEGYLEF